MRIIICFNIIVALLFFVLNCQVPFFSDDVGWIDSLKGMNFLQALEAILDKQEMMWLHENGRLMNHLFWQLSISGGELFYDFLITLVLFFYLIGVVKVGTGRFNTHLLIWVIAVVATLYLSPNSESNFYWAAGGAHYLYPAMLTMLFILLYHKSLIGTIDNRFFILSAIFAFIAGWTHEIFALPVTFAMAVTIFLQYFKKWKGKKNQSPSIQQWVLFSFYALGALLIVFSPGTIRRIHGNYGETNAPLLMAFLSKFLLSFKVFRYGRCFYILIGLISCLLFRKKLSIINFLLHNYFIVLCLLASLAMVMILGVGGRAIWSVEVFSLILILRWLNNWVNLHHTMPMLDKITLVVSIIIVLHLCVLVKPFHDSWNTYKEMVDETKKDHFEGTARMKKWQSDYFFIDAFVAHPYDMMRQDMWMRIPLHCNVCDEKLYNMLLSYGPTLDSTKATICNEEFIIPYSQRIENKIRNGQFSMNLSPIAYDQNGSWLYLSWHQLIQTIWADRYPTSISSLYDDEYSILNIGGCKYIRFEKPVRPIYREIQSVTINF